MDIPAVLGLDPNRSLCPVDNKTSIAEKPALLIIFHQVSVLTGGNGPSHASKDGHICYFVAIVDLVPQSLLDFGAPLCRVFVRCLCRVFVGRQCRVFVRRVSGVCLASVPGVCLASVSSVCVASEPGVCVASEPGVCVASEPGVCLACVPGVCPASRLVVWPAAWNRI